MSGWRPSQEGGRGRQPQSFLSEQSSMVSLAWCKGILTHLTDVQMVFIQSGKGGQIQPNGTQDFFNVNGVNWDFDTWILLKGNDPLTYSDAFRC